jgi:hypothetical protein
VWTCKVTGKGNLTYEEALLSEAKATEKVQQFPKEFMGPVLQLVQFSECYFNVMLFKNSLLSFESTQALFLLGFVSV